MKLIVDISPEDYEYLKSYREFYDTSGGRILKAVCNGKDAMAVIAEVTATALTEIQLEIEEKSIIDYDEDLYDGGECVISISEINDIIQQKINLLQKQCTDNCDNCFNGTTKGGCAVKELMKNKDCKYYMPRKNQ